LKPSLKISLKGINLCIICLFFQWSFGQENQNQLILKTILENYYKNEKPVYKGRSQLLYLYCNQPKNNEELIEAVKGKKLPKDFLSEIQIKINDNGPEKDWSNELEQIFTSDKNQLKSKVNSCLSLEKYQEISKRLNLNNQRLMIVNKPIYYSKGTIALVKVVFFRNIEHNSGTVLLMEKVNETWTIKEYLNSWST
jgi:hypothetical protein